MIKAIVGFDLNKKTLIKNQKISYVDTRGFSKTENKDIISFSGNYEKQEIGLSTRELKNRTKPENVVIKKLLDVNSPEFNSLEEGDKEALAHLVKAAELIEDVFLRLDNHNNIPFREAMLKRTATGDKDAKMALELFYGQKGIIANDYDAQKVVLKRGETKPDGAGFYPKDLTKQEFHKILKQMLKDGQKDEVKKILNQRSIVVRSGKKLKAYDYTDEFKVEFRKIAKELNEAADVSTNKDFNKYLRLQALALLYTNPNYDAKADKQWAKLQDTPLEFTINRECYDDMMTESVLDDKELAKILKEQNIAPTAKDKIGIRVGIVNKQGTQELLEIKKYLPILAQNMPYNDEYEQNISTDETKEIKQTMVDVDLVKLAGDVGKFRAAITIAENLPNDDKLSLKIGGGKRNVFHRQIRMNNDPELAKARAKVVLAPELHEYYNDKADHWVTMLHENVHSCGPKKETSQLGQYRSIIEEAKADMGGISALDKLVEAGRFTEEEKKQAITTFIYKSFYAVRQMPNLDQAHRVRTVMQLNYLIKEGAIEVEKQGKLSPSGIVHINFDKVIPASKKMLAEIVRIQIDDKKENAEKFVKDNFEWTHDMELVARNVRKVNKALNGRLEAPLADYLLQKYNLN